MYDFFDNEVIQFILYIFFSFIVCIIMVTGGYLLGGKSLESKNKNLPFESGVKSTGNTKIKFGFNFYLIAILFVIFDIESVYLYSWVVSISECGWEGFIEALFFVFLLFISLIYLIKLKILK
ncbi:NADH-quinone oxidoreductase subunit A [Buchnera aphidicola (Taiwanaphis decaspermi)]|uniref:NADH-quinone oxidoreductase subunit A n=1 Tax=Buchnera aphidicola TaxID=9 RepID=UPI0031B80E26